MQNVQRLLKQTTNAVLMVRPDDFTFNDETAKDNEFQHRLDSLTKEQINRNALEEFQQSVDILRSKGVEVLVVGKSDFCRQNNLTVPDAVFPNNWISIHDDGTIIQYPMCAVNRRHETHSMKDVLQLLKDHSFAFDEQILYLMNPEEEAKNNHDQFLESTGALIFDHIHKTVYCSLSHRASPKLIQELQSMTQNRYFEKVVLFHSKSSTGKEFYHTNVVLSIGDSFAVICSDCIVDDELNTRAKVIEELKQSGRVVIEISLEQCEKYFCANILQLRTVDEKNEPIGLIAMSDSAHKGFTEEQRTILQQFGSLVVLPVSRTIETIGGGSARCMLCEIRLPKANQ